MSERDSVSMDSKLARRVVQLEDAIKQAIDHAGGRESEWSERAEECFAILERALASPCEPVAQQPSQPLAAGDCPQFKEGDWVVCIVDGWGIPRGAMYEVKSIGWDHKDTYLGFGSMSAIAKNFRIATPAEVEAHLKAASPDGWIEWGGDAHQCPFELPATVETKSRLDEVTKQHLTHWDRHVWAHYGNSDDIIAYRVVDGEAREA